MKRLSKSLTILLIVLTVSVISCTTTPAVTKLEIPPFPLAMPERPVLMEIPPDTSGAIEALAQNLGALINYSEKLESFSKYQQEYLRTIERLIN